MSKKDCEKCNIPMRDVMHLDDDPDDFGNTILFQCDNCKRIETN